MYSLGISYSLHDSSACLVRDGKIVYAVAEERLSRVKHDGCFPVRAIRSCLNFAGIGADKLAHVTIGWPPAYTQYLHDLRSFCKGSHPASWNYFINSTRTYLRSTREGGGAKLFEKHFGRTKARFRLIDHHLAHAISAYALSGFSNAAVVVMDGRGATEATCIYRGANGRLDPVKQTLWPNSLGLFYAEFTHFLGFHKYSDEWKVMGLAPYGNPGVNLDEFIRLDNDYQVDSRALLGRSAEDVSGIERVLGPRRQPGTELTQFHKDIAFAVQDYSEKAIAAVVRDAVQLTSCRDLCLAGGVALNSKANGKLIASGIIDNIFVQPAAGDDGIAIGAAYYPLCSQLSGFPPVTLEHLYLGPEHEPESIEATLKTYKLKYSKCTNPSKTAAQMIADNKIVGWFQGREEFGPRALGGRSILSDARDPGMKDKVNNAVKFREAWRPFAPSMLDSMKDRYLEHSYVSPFMILTFRVRPDRQGEIPATVHVDGTARPQTVTQATNPAYFELLTQFNSLTGTPVVMNTSFNLMGEPIVSSPTDAIRTFYSSGLDALFIGPYLLSK